MTTKTKTCCIDFDGTIVEGAFPKIGKLKPGVVEAIEKLSKTFFIVVYSCRNNSELNSRGRRYYNEMVAFLKENKVPHDGVDDGSRGKPIAEYYIDDRAIRFNDNWSEIAEALTAS